MTMLKALGNNKYYYLDSYYKNRDSVGNVIRYVTRTRNNEDRRDELISYGGAGISCNFGVDYILQQIYQTQDVFDIEDRGGRRMLHEVYALSDEDFNNIGNDYGLLEELARKMCDYYYSQGFEVLYAIHNDPEKHVHIHIVANHISFVDGRKFNTDFTRRFERYRYFDGVYFELYQRVTEYKKQQGIPISPCVFLKSQIRKKGMNGGRNNYCTV